MKDDNIKFITPNWPGWMLETPETNQPNSTQADLGLSPLKFLVDEKIISETVEHDGVVAQVKEPFLESLVNVFVKIVSGILPNSDLKCSYVLDFGDNKKANLFMASDVWSSTANISYQDSEDLELMVPATKEYIRYRCFIDSIQPDSKSI